MKIKKLAALKGRGAAADLAKKNDPAWFKHQDSNLLPIKDENALKAEASKLKERINELEEERK